MKTNLILATACEMIGEDAIATKLGLEERTFTETESKIIGKMLKSLNFVLKEVASEYCPLLFKEEITFTSGEFDLNNLSKTLVYVKSLKSNSGINLKYKIYADKLICGEKKAEIEYCYEPENAAVDGDVELTVPARVLAYGLLREYFLLDELVSEADAYEERFKNSLKVFASKKGELTMPKPIWR